MNYFIVEICSGSKKAGAKNRAKRGIKGTNALYKREYSKLKVVQWQGGNLLYW